MVLSTTDTHQWLKNSTWPYDAEQYLLLNVAIQDNIASSFSESAMEIDYVRVYADGADPSDALQSGLMSLIKQFR